ncbi:MAG: hypothetical protein JWM32_2589 [Verrucomicrobia bacterium]|nr:hypothetical protein [Verrucomicrobiota bacterium]
MTLPAAESLRPSSDQPGTLAFFGSPEAELFTREIAESLAGVLRENLILKRSPDGFPPGFTRASVPPRPWWDTMWTRDAGTFLRELVAWGYIEHACLVSHCLIEGVARNADGYFAFPEKLRPGEPEAGEEIDGTAAIVIGMILLWRHLPAGHAFRGPLRAFLHQPSSPVRYLEQQAGRQGLIAGTGEFGPGCGVDGFYCSCVQNNLAALALCAAAGMEETSGNPRMAAGYRTTAEGLWVTMKATMLDADGGWIWGVRPGDHRPDPAILDEPVNRGTGLHNGVASMYADVMGLDPVGAGWPLATHCEKTFSRLLAAPLRRAQFEKFGFWPQWDPPFRGGLSSGPSYGEGYALQTMLLYDRLDLADKALRWLARATHDAPPSPAYVLHRTSRYHFYERTYSPDAEDKVDLEEGCGALNLVNVTEPLKIARLMLGIDPTVTGEVRIAPRLPACVNRVEARRWPLLTEHGVVTADLTIQRTGGEAFKLTCAVHDSAVIKCLVVRHRAKGVTRTETFQDVTALK